MDNYIVSLGSIYAVHGGKCGFPVWYEKIISVENAHMAGLKVIERKVYSINNLNK